MRHHERFLVYGLLALLAVALLAQGRSGPTAGADPILADDLGPADALVLRGSKGDLRVTNEGGRIAWGTRPTDRALSLAVVDVDRIMKILLEGPRYAEERDAMAERERREMQEFEQKHEEFMRQYGQVRPEHPDYERAAEAWQALREDVERWHADLTAAREKLYKEQIETSWKDLTSAVDVISEQRGIDVVLRFVPVTAPFEAEDPTGGVMQASGRSILRMPEALDITPDVMKELNLRD